MKKVFFMLLLSSALVTMNGCGSNAETKTHTHDDGTTHEDHDTTKPAQQEFAVPDSAQKDTSAHMHDNGETHTH